MLAHKFAKLQPGTLVTLARDVEGRYSDYGGNPKFVARAGETVTVVSDAIPSVRREGVYFRNCSHPNWPEGLSVLASDLI